MDKQKDEIDPDFLDVLIQSISVLSNVATIGSTWFLMRQPRAAEITLDAQDAARQQLRTLRRSLEDTFEALEATLRVIETARERRTVEGVISIRELMPRFGAGVTMTFEELQRTNQFLSQLESSALQARTAARNVLFILGAGPPDHVLSQLDFNPDDFNTQLNSILFDSPTFGVAMEKLRVAQRQAEDFISDAERALRRN